MKILILILSFTYAYGQSDSVIVTEWQTIRVVIGAADTVWRVGEFHVVENTDNKIEVQFRSNGAVIQQRQRFYYTK